MKSIVLSLAFLSVALSDRLDNRYLPPPNNALIANGDYNPYPARAPIVQDLRSIKTSNPIFGQASESRSQYAVPAAQNVDAKVLSRQYLLPANQYSSSRSEQQTEPSGQSTISNNQYSKPNGQFQHSGPASQSTIASGQYDKPNGQFVNTFQHSGPARQSTVSSSQYSKPNGQLVNTFQHSGPAGQSTVSSSQYSKPNGQLVNTFQHSGPAGQSTVSSSQDSKPKGQFSNVFKHSGSASVSTVPSSQYAKLNGQFSSSFQHPGSYVAPNGQYASPNGQFSSTFQQAKPSEQSQASFHQDSIPNVHITAVPQSFEPSGQSTISDNQYSKPIAQFSGAYQPSGASKRFSKPNEQDLSSKGQLGGYSGQNLPSQYYKNANSAAPIAAVRSSNVPNSGDGSYNYNYETENGIMAQEEGSLVNDVENARGGYSYTSPEGGRVVVEYTADGDGFKPTGSHIPQIPEAILKSIELNKASLARGEYQEGQYHEENEQGYAKSGPGGQYGSNSKFEGYNSKYASPILEATVGAPSEASFSSVHSDKFVPAGFQQSSGNGFAPVGGFPSLQQQISGSTVPQLGFAASEPSKIQFVGPQQAYGVSSFQSGKVQDTKGGYKY